MKNCRTCDHRYGLQQKFYKCHVVGIYCSTEMQYGRVCSSELKRWKPRKGVFGRIKQWLFGVKVSE